MTDELEKTLQQQLRASEGELDEATLARLREARARAVAAADSTAAPGQRRNWIPLAAAASVVALAVLITLVPRSPVEVATETVVDNTDPAPQNPEPLLTPAELETALMLVADSEELLQSTDESPDTLTEDPDELLDLYENLEFYEWLALESDVEAAS